MNPLSDSLLTPSARSGAGLGAATGETPGNSVDAGVSPGAGGFAAVLGRMQEERSGSRSEQSQPGAPGAAGPVQNVLKQMDGAEGESAPSIALTEADPTQGLQRQEIAAALALQWAALAGRGGGAVADAQAGVPDGQLGGLPGGALVGVPVGVPVGAPVGVPGRGPLGGSNSAGDTAVEEGLEAVGEGEGPLIAAAGLPPLAGTEAGWAAAVAPPADGALMSRQAAVGEGVGSGMGMGHAPSPVWAVQNGGRSLPEGATAAGPSWMPGSGSAIPGVDGQGRGGMRSTGDPGGAPLATAMAPLKAVQISPHLSVITPATAAPASDQSLIAYAAGQGFDAHALQKIFGASAPQGGGASAPGASGLSGAALGAASSAAVAAGLAPAWAAFQADGGRIALQAKAMGAPGGTPTEASGSAGGVTPTVTAWAALQSRGGLVGGGGDMPQPGVAGQAGSTGLPVGLTALSNLGSMAMANLGMGAAPAANAALTAPLASNEPLGAMLPAAGAGSSPLMGGEALAMAGAAPAPVADSGPRTEAARGLEGQPIDLREHLEDGQEALSRRLGEALAARMISQIERGDWQIRLSVAPQHLGPIDIHLQMQGNRIDAQFQVAHNQTQSLIQDSLPRLRDAVGASGMDLASVWVSGGWNERNRGNPTPGQPDDPTSGALNEADGGEQTVEAVTAADPRGAGQTIRPGAVDILI